MKFQTFRTDKVVTAAAPKAAYQAANTGEGGNQLDMIRKLELGDAVFRRLAGHAGARGIEFMSTPFDLDSLHFLATDVRVRRLKIPRARSPTGRFCWRRHARGCRSSSRPA